MSKSLADILPRVCKSALSEHQQKQAVLWAHWREILGEQFTAQPIRINKTPQGTLFLRSPLHEAMALNYAIPQILENIRYYCGEHFITAIRIEQDYQQAQPPRETTTATHAATPAHNLDEALSRIHSLICKQKE